MALGRYTPDGDLSWFGGRQFVRGQDYIAQKIRQRLGFFRGEWYKDTTLGVPWLQDVLIKSPSLEVVRSVVRRAILDVPGVTSVPTCTVTHDRIERIATISFVAVYGDAQTLEDALSLELT